MFWNNTEPRKIYVNRQSVPWKDKVKYLGHVLTSDLLEYEEVMTKYLGHVLTSDLLEYEEVMTKYLGHVLTSDLLEYEEVMTKYLGHVLTSALLEYEEVMTKKSVKRLNAQFHNVQADMRISLFQTHCTSWYGC